MSKGKIKLALRYIQDLLWDSSETEKNLLASMRDELHKQNTEMAKAAIVKMKELATMMGGNQEYSGNNNKHLGH